MRLTTVVIAKPVHVVNTASRTVTLATANFANLANVSTQLYIHTGSGCTKCKFSGVLCDVEQRFFERRVFLIHCEHILCV